MTAAPKFYAIRRCRSGKVVGSRPMTEPQAEREVRVWAREIGAARVVPASRELAAAVRAYDQSVLAPLLAAEGSPS